MMGGGMNSSCRPGHTRPVAAGVVGRSALLWAAAPRSGPAFPRRLVVSAVAERNGADYNAEMAAAMGWTDPFKYYPERGLYYHDITPGVICGSQPMTAADVTALVEREGVTHILNLQQDKDLRYWNVDLQELLDASRHHGVELLRTPAVDFDPNSLRATLPAAVAMLERSRGGGGKVYVHCTAGLGRSPAVCIASLYWFGGMQLDEAYHHLVNIRPCGPNKDAIRGATYDILNGGPWDDFQRMPPNAYASLSEHDRSVLRDRIMSRGLA